MLRQGGVVCERPDIKEAWARAYTCGYRGCVTRAEVSFVMYDGTAQGRTVTLDIALGGLEVGMSKARRKIAREITEYKEAETAREISARQESFFNQFREPPKPKHKKASDYMARSWLGRRF
jgi:hypothetical protein